MVDPFLRVLPQENFPIKKDAFAASFLLYKEYPALDAGFKKC